MLALFQRTKQRPGLANTMMYYLDTWLTRMQKGCKHGLLCEKNSCETCTQGEHLRPKTRTKRALRVVRRVYAGCTQGVRRVYAGCTQGVRRAYAGCTQGIRRVYAGCAQGHAGSRRVPRRVTQGSRWCVAGAWVMLQVLACYVQRRLHPLALHI